MSPTLYAERSSAEADGGKGIEELRMASILWGPSEGRGKHGQFHRHPGDGRSLEAVWNSDGVLQVRRKDAEALTGIPTVGLDTSQG